MAPLSTLQTPRLKELYLTSNKLSSIEVHPYSLGIALWSGQDSMLVQHLVDRPLCGVLRLISQKWTALLDLQC